MKKITITVLLAVFSCATLYGQNCVRRDDFVSTAVGQAVAGAHVTYYGQSGIGQPRGGLASAYLDPACTVPMNPATTDGMGHAFAYMAPGYYTIVYSAPVIKTQTLVDQALVGTGLGASLSGATFTGPVSAPMLQGVAQCPSVTYSDIGTCSNAATTASQINFLDGSYSSAVVLTPQPSQVLHFGVGTYTVGGITLPDSTTASVDSASLVGSGQNNTILLLASGANRDLVTDTHFSSLTNTSTVCPGTLPTGGVCSVNAGALYGAYQVRIQDITLDGNRGNESGTSWPLRLYGRASLLQNVTLQKGLTGCRYTEWNMFGDISWATPNGENYLPDTFNNVTEQYCGGDGVEYLGPHDSMETNGQSYCVGMGTGSSCYAMNGHGWGYNIQTSYHVKTIGAFITGTTGGAGGACWTHVLGSIKGIGANCATGGAGTYGLLVDNTGGPAGLSASIITGDNALVLNQGNNLIQAAVTGTTSAVTINGGANNLDISMNTEGGYWFVFTAENDGPSTIIANGDQGTGTLFSGTPISTDTLLITNAPSSYYTANGVVNVTQFGGVVTARTVTTYDLNLGDNFLTFQGWKLYLPPANDTLVAPSLAQTWGALQTFNAGVTLTAGNLTLASGYDIVAAGWTFAFPAASGTLPVTSATTPTVGAGVCWKTSATLGTCTAGTWPNCTTCN